MLPAAGAERMLVTTVPEELAGRGIELPQHAHGFAISLDAAEPWGAGRIEGRVEARQNRHDPRPLNIAVRCLASWLDLPPQLVGQRRLFSIDWEVRRGAIPIWIDEEVWLERSEIGDLRQTNWLPFGIELPPELPRAFEGTFASFRWRVVAFRPRRIGNDTASLPLVLLESRTIPVVRIEKTPIGE